MDGGTPRCYDVLMNTPLRIAIPGDDPPQLAGSPHLDRLRARGEVVLHLDRPADDAEKIRRVRGAVCMINSHSAVKWPGSVLKELPELRMITVVGIGTDSIDLTAARDLGISSGGTTPDLRRLLRMHQDLSIGGRLQRG